MSARQEALAEVARFAEQQMVFESDPASQLGCVHRLKGVADYAKLQAAKPEPVTDRAPEMRMATARLIAAASRAWGAVDWDDIALGDDIRDELENAIANAAAKIQ